MPITAMPTAPSSARPSTFNPEMDAFLAAFAGFVTEANALAAQLNALTGQTQWVVAGGTADVITATFNPAIALTDGAMAFVRATAANATTTPTFNANALGAKTMTKKGGQALAANDISGAGHELILRYNLANTRWELLNPASSSEFTSGTFTVSDGSGASLAITSSFVYRAHATFYAVWGEIVYPSTANGSGAALTGFPFTSRSCTFAVAGWYIPVFFTNGNFATNANPIYLVANSNATTGTFRTSGGTQSLNSDFSTWRMGLNSQIPR
jgi:hypothetical protein